MLYLKNITIHSASLESYASLSIVIQKIKPDEVYHLAAQSYIDYAFKDEFSTMNTNINGTHYLLSIIKNFSPKSKFYFAGSSEMFGKVTEIPQKETTRFYPRSVYGISKCAGYELTRNYREAYNLFCCSGILFNHESPRRGVEFVTRKITIALSKIAFGLEDFLCIGNLYAKRDWGHARDYAKMQWKILQTKKSDDYVISSGKNYTVKSFFELCCKYLKIRIKWKGVREKEIALVENFDKKICPKLKKNQIILKVDKKYFRPSEVNNLKGDSSKAQKYLHWKIKSNIKDLVKDMMDNDYNHYRKIFFS